VGKFQQRYEKRHGSLGNPFPAKALCAGGAPDNQRSVSSRVMRVASPNESYETTVLILNTAMSTHRKWIFPVLILICSAFIDAVKADDFAAAVSAGKVQVSFRGNGASSGDSIEVLVTRTDKTGGNLELTVAPGTRLQSGNRAAQIMVIAAVKGRVMGENSYSPSSVIEVGDTPTTYVLEAYCSEFEKDNPSSATTFHLGPVDPVLACDCVQSRPDPLARAP
jgi:hypothetical protein